MTEHQELNKRTLTIDFSQNDLKNVTLFTGRKNGRKAKSLFSVTPCDQYIFKANSDQVITSSYFLGLIGDELRILLGNLNDINELISKIDTSSLNQVSQEECVRAVRRGLSSDEIEL